MNDLLPFAITIKGNESAVRDGLDKAMACLAPLHLNVDDAGTVELVLAEALNNVVEHALVATDGQTTIEIRGCHGAAGLSLTLIDRGAPMPAGKTPNTQAPDLDVQTADMPEGGFGWFMIHSLASDVKYARIGASNHLSLQLPVGV